MAKESKIIKLISKSIITVMTLKAIILFLMNLKLKIQMVIRRTSYLKICQTNRMLFKTRMIHLSLRNH